MTTLGPSDGSLRLHICIRFPELPQEVPGTGRLERWKPVVPALRLDACRGWGGAVRPPYLEGRPPCLWLPRASDDLRASWLQNPFPAESACVLPCVSASKGTGHVALGPPCPTPTSSPLSSSIHKDLFPNKVTFRGGRVRGCGFSRSFLEFTVQPIATTLNSSLGKALSQSQTECCAQVPDRSPSRK